MVSLQLQFHQLRYCCCHRSDDAVLVVAALHSPSHVFAETSTTTHHSGTRLYHSCRLPLFQTSRHLAKFLWKRRRQGSCTASVYPRRDCYPPLAWNGS